MFLYVAVGLKVSVESAVPHQKTRVLLVLA